MNLFASLLLTATLLLAACEVHFGDCREDDAGNCVDLDPFPRLDASLDSGIDAGFDAAVASDAAQAPPDAAVADSGSSLDSGVRDAMASTLSLEDMCRGISERGLAWASKLDECCLDRNERTSAEAATILNLIGAYSDQAVDGCINFYRGLMGDAGTVSYDPALGSACVAAFQPIYPLPPGTCPAAGFDVEQLRSTIGHGASQLAQLSACRGALRGRIAQGQPCSRDFECLPSLTCRAIATGPSAGSTCESPSTNGSLCENNGDCAFGLSCVGSQSLGRVCRPDLVDLGSCSAAPECVVGKVCSGGSCAAPVLGTVICD